MMMILNYAKLGIRNKDQSARDKAFEKILKAGQRATKITNAVLGMARNRSEHRSVGRYLWASINRSDRPTHRSTSPSCTCVRLTLAAPQMDLEE